MQAARENTVIGRWALGLLSLAVLAGCAHTKIPNTNVDDTPDNRKIIELVVAYQTALENRDADALMSLVSPEFYEDNGNTDKSDDYDREGLRESLAEEFERTERLQLELRVDSIEVEENKAFAFVLYTIRAHNAFPAGEKWQTASDRSRFELENREGRWMILSGI